MFLFFKQKTAYDVRISDWSSDVCSSVLFWNTLSPIRKPLPEKPLSVVTPPMPARSSVGMPGRSGLGDPLGRSRILRHEGMRANAKRDQERRQIGRASCRERVCQYV